MMKKAFSKTQYRFIEKPPVSNLKEYGIYIHIPFCFSKCDFCPFYKEVYNEKQKNDYVKALVEEILNSNILGAPEWIYIGGGTPNTLSASDYNDIVQALRNKVEIRNMGIELLPSRVDEGYINRLKELGFNKISIGVESMDNRVIDKSGRITVSGERIEKIIKYALYNGMFVNVDLIVGLNNQDENSLIKDIRKLMIVKPSQITIYPYMCINARVYKGQMSDSEQFSIINRAGNLLATAGYIRKSVWTFGLNDDVYDSSRDELVIDYIGFGAGAFSTYGNYKVVNNKVSEYLINPQIAIVATKDKVSDDFRKFGRMIYDLRLDYIKGVSPIVNMFVFILKLLGYSWRSKLNKRGVLFAHAMTKTIVENLPYPLQNPDKIINE